MFIFQIDFRILTVGLEINNLRNILHFSMLGKLPHGYGRAILF